MTRDPDLGLDAGAPLDPELEAAARRQLRRLADAIDVDLDADLDLDVYLAAASPSDTDEAADPSGAGGAIPGRPRRARAALLAAAVLAVVALGAAVVLVTTGGSPSDDVAAGDRDGRGGGGEHSSVAGGQPDRGGEPVPTELPDWLAGPWLAQDDQPMPTDGRGPTLGIYQGAEHCSWEQVTFVELSWPPGFVQNPLPLNRQFARDPAGVLGPDTGVRGSYDGDATLPADAVATELHNAEAELWVAESNPDVLYVRRSDGTVERWPRVEPLLLCA